MTLLPVPGPLFRYVLTAATFSIFMAVELNTSFSTSGEDAIQKVIDVQPDTSTLALSPHQFEDFYEIGRTAEEIVKSNYRRVRCLFHLINVVLR